MLVVALVSFSLFNFVGDPINNMVGEETSDEEREELRESLGLNDGIYVQFSRFIINASKGEFGISYQLRRPVSDLIIERLPATIELVVVSALIALISGTLLGVYTGINRKGFFSDIILAISLLGVSLPTFVIGILFIYLFAVILGILPSFGRGEVVDLGFWSTGFLTVSGLKAIILPSVTLSLFQMTYIIRLVRAEMMEILQTDYIKFARARGINEKSIYYKHALKNGLIPVITIAGINIGTLIAFSIITETVFQWPGWGVPTLDSHYVFHYLYESGASWNKVNFSNSEVDAAIRVMEGEVDLDKRNEAIAKAWKIVKDDISYLPLHHQVISWASKSNVDVPIRPNNEPLFRFASFN